MRRPSPTALATALVACTGALWGLYWLPVRALAGGGLTGAWGTAAITLAACLILSPALRTGWRRLAAAPAPALGGIALGGAAFALYSVGLVHGRVAIIVLLFFLTPVWSTLIGRYVMGWPTPPMRILAIGTGLAGLALTLGAGGQAPVPRSAGEWMALLAGLLWAVSSTAIRARPGLAPAESAFVFAAGASLAALALAPLLGPWPGGALAPGAPALAAIALGAGGLWWAVSVAALIWAAARLDPARVGILLMVEVLVGAVSAALLAGEHLSAAEIAGGILVLVAGALEVWPARRPAA